MAGARLRVGFRSGAVVMMLVLAGVVACGTNARVGPRVAMMPTPNPPKPQPTVSPEEAERDWHGVPEPIEGTGLYGSPPIYPHVLGQMCRYGGRIDDETIMVCGHDAVRFGATTTIIQSIRERDFKNELPESVDEKAPDDLWVETRPRYTQEEYVDSSSKPWDPFFVYHGSYHRFHKGQWTQFSTQEWPRKYRGGWLSFDLPRYPNEIDRKKPGCEDFACVRVLPKFWAADTQVTPDLSALEGKIAWIHPYDGEKDYAYEIEESGSIYVLLRALDIATNRRSIGVISWNEKDGARYTALPQFAGDVHFEVNTDRPTAPKNTKLPPGSFEFDIRTWVPDPKATSTTSYYGSAGEKKYTVRRAATSGSWTVTKTPPPKPRDPLEGYEVPSDGPDLGGYSTLRSGEIVRRNEDHTDWERIEGWEGGGQLTREKKHNDFQLYMHGTGMWRSIKPTELLSLSDSWGHLYPWPNEVEEKKNCDHPFVVFDRMPVHAYEAVLEEGKKQGFDKLAPWGVLPEGWTHLELVEFRIFQPPLVIIGAELSSMEEAVKLKELFDKRKVPDWDALTLSTMNERQSRSVVCARPVNPKPFAPHAN